MTKQEILIVTEERTIYAKNLKQMLMYVRWCIQQGVSYEIKIGDHWGADWARGIYK